MQEIPQIETVFDDSELHIGQVYATALLRVASKSGNVDAVVDEVQSVVDAAFNASPDLEAVFSNPRVDATTKSRILDRLFSGKLSDTSLKFLKVLASRQRLGSLRSVAKAASEMRDDAAGRLQVQVTTAQAMMHDQVDQLKMRLAQVFNAEIRLNTKVDPDILGGMIVRVGDTLYDASVDGRLRKMQRESRDRAEVMVRQRINDLAT